MKLARALILSVAECLAIGIFIAAAACASLALYP